MPADVISKVLARGTKTNIGVIPADVFDTCTSTTGSQEVIKVTKSTCDDEKWLALDVIGTFGLLTAVVSIDELPMWVYAVDGEYITPQKVQAMSVTNGDRFSVLVKMTTPGDYTVRVASTSATMLVAGYATIQYREDKSPAPAARQSTAYINDAGVNLTSDVVFFSQAKQKAFPPAPPAARADQLSKLTLRVAGQSYMWALNETIYPPALDSASPLLFNPNPNLNNNVTITTRNNTWVDLLLVTATFPMPPHPIHKHGNKMWMIGAGQGAFNWTTIEEAAAVMPQNFNFIDPPRRDGFATLPAVQGPTWMVLRYQVTNPGPWLLHCHINSHQVGGMNMVIQDGPEVWPKVPAEYLNYN
jgi:FtsP/CotA-like multicopper oxidase with cupredoxin domain